MSGGRFNYNNSSLMSEMFQIWGDSSRAYSPQKHGNPMQDLELSELVYDVLLLIEDLDYYLSGDSDRYHRESVKFKRKWLRSKDGQVEKRLRKIIERAFEDKKKECLKIIK